MAISIFSFPASAASSAKYDLGFDVNAKAYIVVSLDTGETVFEKDADRQYTPASLTKLMTAYVVMKNVEDLDGTMVTAPASVYDELYGTNSSTARAKLYRFASFYTPCFCQVQMRRQIFWQITSATDTPKTFI